jgi:hypothetical protein
MKTFDVGNNLTIKVWSTGKVDVFYKDFLLYSRLNHRLRDKVFYPERLEGV